MAKILKLEVSIVTESVTHCSDHCPMMRRHGYCGYTPVYGNRYVTEIIPLKWDNKTEYYERHQLC